MVGGPPSPTAFVSWAHSSSSSLPAEQSAWESQVYGFTNMLRAIGIDADVDLFHVHDPDVDWTRFGPTKITSSSYVLILSSRGYSERWEGRNDPTEGAGAAREADTLKGMFDQDQSQFQRKVKIVLLPGAATYDIPLELKRLQRFVLPRMDRGSLEPLIRTLTDQPRFKAAPLGAVPVLECEPTTTLEVERGGARLTGMHRELRSVEENLENLSGEAPEGSAQTWLAAREQLVSRHRHLLANVSALLNEHPFGAALRQDLDYAIAISGPHSFRGVDIYDVRTHMTRVRNVSALGDVWISFARTREALDREFKETSCLGREFVPVPEDIWDELYVSDKLSARLGVARATRSGYVDRLQISPSNVQRDTDLVRCYFSKEHFREQDMFLCEARFVTTVGTTHFPIVLTSESEFNWGTINVSFELDDREVDELTVIEGFSDHKKIELWKDRDRKRVKVYSNSPILIWPSSQIIVVWTRSSGSI